jgi:hypothetical protein
MRKVPHIRSKPVARSRRPSGVASPPIDGPERLVGLGFRYWVLGRQTGNVACWERAWDLYSGMFGVAGGRVAMTHLSSWVGVLGATACRTIEVADGRCPNFCRDECIAIAMIAACQHRTCPALRACAFALVETSHINGVVGEAQDFADSLASLDTILSPASILRGPADFIVHTTVAH